MRVRIDVAQIKALRWLNDRFFTLKLRFQVSIFQHQLLIPHGKLAFQFFLLPSKFLLGCSILTLALFE